MNKQFTIGAVMLLLASGLVGCSNTAEGAKEDTTKNAEAVKNTADSAAQTAKDTGKAVANATDQAAQDAGKAVANLGDAAATPKVKMALSADEELSKADNAVINVDTHDGKVILRGHVKTNAMKKKAEDIAKKTLQDARYTDIVQNTLTVDTK